MSLKILFFFALFPVLAQASVVTYKPVTLTVSDHLRLKITGLRGRVILRGNSGAAGQNQIIVKKFDDRAGENSPWYMSVVQDDKLIHLKVKGPADQAAWLAGSEAPEFEVTVSGQALPVEVYWQKGKVIETGWRSPSKIVMVEGEIFSDGGEGQRELVVNKQGKVQLKNLKGDLQARLFDAELKMENCTGAVSLENFSGKSWLGSHQGALGLTSYNGHFELKKVAGDVDFQLARGSLNAVQYEGKMKGRAVESWVTVAYEGASNINLNSTSGNVRILAPGNSAAQVDVGSKEGNLFVPGHFKVTRYPTQKVGVGRLSGGQASWVYVRTDSGDISVR